MMQSLRRKQAAEENRIRHEEELRKRREEEAKAEDILEQYRLKKEQERLEEEGGRMPEPVSARPVPRMRPKSTSKTQIGGPDPRPGPGPRQRPRTIHVDDGADIAESLASSRVGPRGSSSNISEFSCRSENKVGMR